MDWDLACLKIAVRTLKLAGVQAKLMDGAISVPAYDGILSYLAISNRDRASWRCEHINNVARVRRIQAKDAVVSSRAINLVYTVWHKSTCVGVYCLVRSGLS